MKKTKKGLIVLTFLAVIAIVFNVYAKPDGVIDAMTYFRDGRTQGVKVTNSQAVKIDTQIDMNEYSFALGGEYTSFEHGGSAGTLTAEEKEKWLSNNNVTNAFNSGWYYTRVDGNNAERIKNGNFWVKYKNAGIYNGKKVDVKMSVMDVEPANPVHASNGRLPVIAFYENITPPRFFSEVLMGVETGEIEWVELKFDFYEAGTNTPIKVKGYTTYWDIDYWQGIHLVNNNKGIYAASNSGLYYTTQIGTNQPFVYDGEYLRIGSEFDTRGYFAETFEGTSITRVFAFSQPNVSGDSIDTSSIYGTAGGIWLLAVPGQAAKEYDATSDIHALDSVKKGDTIKYRITFNNGPGAIANVVIKDTLSKGLKYKANSAKLVIDGGDGGSIATTTPNPTPSTYTDDGQELTWSGITLDPAKNGTLTYEVEVTDKAAVKVINKAVVKVGDNPEYELTRLENPVYLGVNYTSDAGGKITQPGTENNIYTENEKQVGDNPSGVTHQLNKGYCEFKGWKFDKAVTINGSTIEVGSRLLTDAEVKTIVLAQANDNMTFTAIHEKCKAPSKTIKQGTTPIANDAVKVGDVITYEIKYINSDINSQDIVITDTLSPGLKFKRKVSGSAEPSENGQTITFTDNNVPGVNEQGGREERVLVYEVEVTSGAKSVDRVYNNASVQVGNDTKIDLDPVKNPVPHKVYGGTSVTDNPGWDNHEVKEGQSIKYKVTLPNTSSEKQPVVVTDVLSKGLSYNKDIKVSGGTLKGSTENKNNETGITTLTWTVEVNANAVATLEYSAKVTKEAVNLVNNQASVQYDRRNIILDELYNPVPKKQYDVDTANGMNGKIVQKEDVITYNIAFANGKKEVQKIELKDILSKGLSYKEKSAKVCNENKTECKKIEEVMSETVTKNSDGTTTILWTIDKMAGHDVKIIVYDVKVTGETIKVQNGFEIKYPGGEWTDINELPNPVPVKEYAQDTLSGKDSSAVAVKDTIRYEIRYVNVADEKVTVTIKDTLSEGIEYLKGTAKIGTEKITDPEMSNNNKSLVWTRELEPNQEEELTYEVIVTGEVTEVNNKASMIYSNNPDYEREIGELHNPVPKKQYAESSKIKTFGEQVKKNDVITYEIAYSNVKETKSNVVITDILSKGLEYRKGTAKIDGKKAEPDNIVKTSDGTVLIWSREIEANKASVLTYEARVDGTTKFVENNANIKYDNDEAIPLAELRNPLPNNETIKVPDTASTVSKIAISVGVILICAGGLVILKRKQI